MDIRYQLPPDVLAALDASIADWTTNNRLAKLWSRDATLWTNTDESKWLGWLDIVERQLAKASQFESFAEEVSSAEFENVLLLGMGGSSLCPDVLADTFGQRKGFPTLRIVDSTDPAQILTAEKSVKLKKTLCVVSSKSGTTLEPNILKQYFFERMREALQSAPGSHFIAITDPGSKMESVAKQDKFRHIFYGDPAIGGRYSALSDFGIVPAAAIGIDTRAFLTSAQLAVEACRNPRLQANPGALLGLILGSAAQLHRDKLTIFASPEIYDLGAWLEQLIAESTGKEGRGITPVDLETIGAPHQYGRDRVFAFVRLEGGDNADLDSKLDALAAAGQPVVRLALRSKADLGQQFFIWEIATAVAGSIIGINAFNQPDVEASKIETRKLTDEYEQTGKLAEQTPIFTDGEIQLFADRKYAAVLHGAGAGSNLASFIRAHLAQLHPGDYYATLAYIERNKKHQEALQIGRMRVRDARHNATCLGFGPRFLHSTGQDYKGGPNTGVFLQVTADHPHDLAIPGAKYTFGTVIAAQAAGDLAVLQQRDRRALRLHLGKDIEGGLRRLNSLIAEAV
jgi:glucose-6-phosphate isomerase